MVTKYRAYQEFPSRTYRYPVNVWVKPSRRAKYWIRKQRRTKPQQLFLSADDIDLDALKSRFSNSTNGTRYWYQAKSWTKAKKILRKGPKLSADPADMGCGGACYWNPDFDDCYQWLRTKNRSFRGKHAILIYQFDPEMLSRHGRELFDLKKWKQTVVKRSTSGRCKDDWTYTFQNSRPGEVRESTDNVKKRMVGGVKPAEQLIVYREKMCRKIRHCLLGCVFFERLSDEQD